eukprot:PITA_11040
MIRKNALFKWGSIEKEAFDLIKQSIINAPSLITPNFSNPFTLYTIASNSSYAAVLTQLNDHNLEASISFFSSNLQGAELNYSDVEKQAFAMFKAVKYYRPFLLKTHTKVIVPFPAVRQLLLQKELGEKRENWVTTLQEYDLEIRPAKIVRGQGFCRILAGASNIPESSDTSPTEEINKVNVTDSQSQYADLIFYLKNGHAPPHLSYKNKRAIRLKAKTFTIIDDVLFKRNYDSILLRCLEKTEAQKVLQELQDGPAGGHFGADTTTHKIIHAGYYWPTLFRDTHEFVRKFLNCQTAGGRQRKSAFPLQPVNIEQPFDQWGLDIIGEINPPSSKQHRYILTATDYFTKWVEALPLKSTNSEAIIEFIDQFIITRVMVWQNQLNKYLIKIIKRTIEQNHRNWHKSLVFALWADRITQNASIGTSPFNLVYGKEAILPTNLVLPSLALVQFIEEAPSSSIQLKYDQILKLEEEREKAKDTHAKH